VQHLFRAQHTIFGLDSTGVLERFHFNNLDRDVLRLPADQVNKYAPSWFWRVLQ
jgi:hypothetical protein